METVEPDENNVPRRVIWAPKLANRALPLDAAFRAHNAAELARMARLTETSVFRINLAPPARGAEFLLTIRPWSGAGLQFAGAARHTQAIIHVARWDQLRGAVVQCYGAEHVHAVQRVAARRVVLVRMLLGDRARDTEKVCERMLRTMLAFMAGIGVVERSTPIVARPTESADPETQAMGADFYAKRGFAANGAIVHSTVGAVLRTETCSIL